MVEKIEPSFFGDDIKLCHFCKKKINFDTKICPFCEQELLGNLGSNEPKISESLQSSTQAIEDYSVGVDRNKEVLKGETENSDLEGIKGWLILIGIGLVISPFKLLISMGKLYMPYFEPGVLESLTAEGSPSFIPYFKILFFSESIYNSLLIVFSFYLIYLFFSKSKIFPKAYIACMLVSLFFIPFDALISSLVLTNIEPFDIDTAKEFGQVLIQAVIWIPYLLNSKRVKFTFIR